MDTAVVEVGVEGYAPIVTVQSIDPERGKYERMWKCDEYRVVAPGENAAMLFLSLAKPSAASTIIDFGCGTGRGALRIARLSGARVTMLDFASNCLDQEVRDAGLPFVRHDLREPTKLRARYGYCTDVMEHIEPEHVDSVLQNVLQAAQFVFFQISTTDDALGALIGEPLHLSVHDSTWWAKKFADFGCLVQYAAVGDGVCMFYVTAWATGQDVADVGVLNVDVETVRKQVETNVRAGWMQVAPHLEQDTEVIIAGGGPSLRDSLDDIKRLREAGAKLITLNGAYNWCLAQGLKVSGTIVVDAREFNARFTHPIVDDTKYFVASQCHPSVLEGLPDDRTYLWHTTAETIRDVLDSNLTYWWGVPGGSTVLLRAIPLLRMLGYKRFHLFGCDSCLSDKQAHAFEQPENDGDIVIECAVGDRMFKATPWMVSQAQEFMDLIRFLGDEIELEVYGDGMIAHILRTGAELSERE
jgi:hypothetical protein